MSDLTDRLRCFDRQTCTEAAERIETLEAELAAMRAGGAPVARIEGIDEYGPRIGWFKHWTDVAIGTHLYARPRPATPLEEGFTLVAVKGFDDLMYWLDRCESKGHLENCSDLIEPWANFDYRAIAAQQGDSHE